MEYTFYHFRIKLNITFTPIVGPIFTT